MDKRLKVVSLFSGCGGLDLGFTGGFKFRHYDFSKTNFDIVFANDYDVDAARVYLANEKYFTGHSFENGDVRDLLVDNIPDFDVLLAGFPCQPFSNAGNRGGVSDKSGRGTLFYECERIINGSIEKGKIPKAFVFENVRGILTSKMPDGSLVTDEILGRMSSLGYNVSMKLIKSSDYGVPQNRSRVIIVGVRNDIPVFDFGMLDKIVKEYNLPTVSGNSYELTLGSIFSDIS